MSLFRKQPQTAAPTNAPPERDPVPPTVALPAPSQTPTLYHGPQVDIPAIYREAKLGTDELDRVIRAGELLHLLPSKASHTREIVDATFRAFSVDRSKIVEAATKQLDALERFIRYSHGQTQRVLDANAQRIAELEAEIERCRQSSAVATSEGEERARTVNNALLQVQRVLAFFGDDTHDEVDLDDSTVVGSTEIPPAPKSKAAAAKPV